MSPKASSIIPDKNISFLFKGPFGLGKTIAACSAAAFGPIHLSYFDKRVPIEVFTFFTKIGRQDILENIDYDSYNATNANDYLNDLFKRQKNSGYYVADITDSVTNLTSAAVNWSMGWRDPKGPKKDKIDKDSVSLTPDWDEYKVETSLVTQALDVCKNLPGYMIWIAHPLPQTKVEGSGNSMTVTKSTSIVSYGSKVAGIIPGNFTEIYHFSRQVEKRIVWTDMTGDDFAKTALSLPKSFDITDKLFFNVWRELVDKSLSDMIQKEKEVKNEVKLSVDFESLSAGDKVSKWKT